MDSDKKTKILITGALGHIGSALMRNLGPHIDKEVVVLDNLETKRYPSLFRLPEGFTFRLIEEDITTADLGKHFAGIDVVVHLAAVTDAEGSKEIPDHVEAVNFGGLKRVADACLENGVRLIFPSTTSVYGSQTALVDERCTELKPQSPYAESKLKSEKYLVSLREKGLKFVICRFGTIFGYSIGMRFHTAVNKFVWQAASNQPLSVWKTAWKQRRPYLDLRDCVSAINFIIEKDLFDGETYNVVTKNFTVEEVVTTIKNLVPKLEVNYVDSAIMNQLSYDVDASKFASQGFTTAGDIVEGIRGEIEALQGIIKK